MDGVILVNYMMALFIMALFITIRGNDMIVDTMLLSNSTFQ